MSATAILGRVETTSTEAWPIVLRLGPLSARMSDDEFFEICQANRHLRIERTRDGELSIMPPTGGGSANREFTLAGLFFNWVEADGTGIGFSSSAGFLLPNGAVRSPDLAWVEKSRWDALTPEQQEKFPPLCPDFVAKIRSRSDSLPVLKAKMQEYIDNGVRLGWLIDPLEKVVYIYRPGAKIERFDEPAMISGDPLLPGFRLDLRRLWP
jgi:Uma2 family endonuclease